MFGDGNAVHAGGPRRSIVPEDRARCTNVPNPNSRGTGPVALGLENAIAESHVIAGELAAALAAWCSNGETADLRRRLLAIVLRLEE
jgi:hypothetical protein